MRHSKRKVKVGSQWEVRVNDRRAQWPDYVHSRIFGEGKDHAVVTAPDAESAIQKFTGSKRLNSWYFYANRVGENPEKAKRQWKYANARKEIVKKANGIDIFRTFIDYPGIIKVYNKIRKVDQQSADLLREVMDTLSEEMDIPRRSKEALNRVQGLASRGQNWDPALIRNNVFKAANDLGIKLPSGMFASKHARKRRAAWLAPNMKRALLRLFNADGNSLRKHTAWDLRHLKISIPVANFLWDRKLIEPCCPEANDVEVTAKLTDKGAKAAQMLLY